MTGVATAPQAASRTARKRASDPSAFAWSAAETWWFLAVTALAVLLFATTFSSAVGLGDAPESVSGIRDLGVLHAPGYPTYVLLGKLWGTVLPVGDWALRVNLFSLVCSSLTIGLVYVLGRLFGARRPAAAVGAFAVATSVSFWFNAGFAKHYALSALLVSLAAVMVVWWERAGGRGRLLTAGVALGVGAGASWELSGIMALGLAALMIFGTRRITWHDVWPALTAAVGLALAVWGFVLVRAGQDPAINWGNATDLGRLVNLILHRDFLTGESAPSGVRALPDAPGRAASYGVITLREVGLAVVLLAVVGAVVVIRRRAWGDALFFGLVLLANFAGAIFVSGLDGENGIASGMIVGGFLIDVVIVAGVLVAIGTSAFCDGVASWADGLDRNSLIGSTSPPVVRGVVVGAVAVAILLPSLIVHAPYATHRRPPFADRYAQRVLSSLPDDAVLVVWGWEFAQPMRYRQLVHGERPDVTIFSGAESPYEWYREQLRDEVPDLAPPIDAEKNQYVLDFIAKARAERPVYVDMSAMSQFTGAVGFELDGSVAKFAETEGAEGSQGIATVRPLDDASRRLHRAQADDGWYGGAGRYFPNVSTSLFEMRAALFVAALHLSANDPDSAAASVRDAIAIRPDLEPLREALRLVEEGDPNAQAQILALAAPR
jgi:hypothetical protein